MSNGRYTYSLGSRAEGCVVYDNDLKLHVHHDSCPARGQSNAFDLVRKMKFGELDAGLPSATPVFELPSYKAMMEFARSLPEVQKELAENEFEILPETPSIELPVQRRRFQIIPAAEFAVGSPLAWIIKSVLPRAELGVIYGESGAGKSFLALDLCTAISRGVEWNGLKVAPGRVIYVCAEGADGFRNRLNAYARKHEVPLTTLPGVVADAPNLLEVEHVLDLTREIVAQGKADLIVVDTLAATTPGGNENSGEDMGKVISHCKSMHKATGAMVVLIHHSGKDAAKGARGWSGIKAAMDFEMEVTRNGDYRLATLTKLKDGEDQKSWHFKLNQVILGLDEDGEDIASCVVDFIDPPEGAGKRAPTGIREKAMFELAKQMLLDGTCIVTDLLDRAVKLMPVDNSGKDSRRAACKRGLEKLLEHGHLYLHDGESLTTSSAVQATEEDFDKKATA